MISTLKKIVYVEPVETEVSSDALLTLTFRAIKENKNVRDNNPMDIIFGIGCISDYSVDSIVNLFKEVVESASEEIRTKGRGFIYRDFTFDVARKSSDEVFTVTFKTFKEVINGISVVLDKMMV